jgi:hypothetical protein
MAAFAKLFFFFFKQFANLFLVYIVVVGLVKE